jgi:DUF971 family protein
MQAWPETIEWHAQTKMLALAWPSEPETRLSASLLRQACRCATCEQARRQGQTVALTDHSLSVAEISPVGITGLQLSFSDGHDRGIYPWAYLRQLAQRRSMEPA